MNNNTCSIKAYINRYFSQELQLDETPVGAMERNQLRKWMLHWAADYDVPQQDIQQRQLRKLQMKLAS